MMIRAIISLLLSALLLPVFTLGCHDEAADGNGVNAMSKVAIPAIDAALPAVTATATFALG